MILTILRILFLIFTLYILLSCTYIFVFALAAVFRKQHKNFKQNTDYKTVLFIPAYKEDVVILNVAKSACEQNYPKDKLDIVLIADQLKETTLEKLRKLPIQVIEVHFEKSTKAKALNFALDQIKDNYDTAVIIDADNIMQPDFIAKLNDAFRRGFSAVQGHRTAKNTNTPVALLDAISEEINNSIFRQGHRALGFSSAFIGSGLAVKFDLFKKLMKNVTHVGEDKELEVFLLKNGHQIEYIPDAVVYDEKIQAYGNMVNQRRRWLFAQFDFFAQYIKDASKALFRGKTDYFDKVAQQALIPRSLLIGICGLYFLIYLILKLIGIHTGLYPGIWLGIAFLLVTALLFAIPLKYYNKKTLFAIMYLPRGIWVMLTSLLRSRISGNSFLHTQHEIENHENSN